MKNWLTTLFGSVTAVGMFLSGSSNHTLSVIGQIAQTVGALLLGGSAKDASNKS